MQRVSDQKSFPWRERMGVQLNKAAPRQCVNTVDPRGLASASRSAD